MRKIMFVWALWGLCGVALGQGSFYRTAEGVWKPLQATSAGGMLKFTLSPEQIGGNATLIVLNKPKWMILEDREPPTIIKVLVDTQERKIEELDLGLVATPPGEIAFAVKDDKNPLEASAVRVWLNGQALPPAQISVTKLSPDNKMLRVAIKLGAVPPARYTLTATVRDLAPEANSVSLTLKFSTAPLLANGSFEELDTEGKPVGWTLGAWSADATTKYEAGVVEGGVAGRRAFRFVGIAGTLNLVLTQQLEPLRPGVPYVLSGQYKSEGGAAVSVITQAGGQQAEYLTHSLPPAKDWTPFSYEFQLKPHDSVLIVPRTGSKGETYFDDLKLAPK